MGFGTIMVPSRRARARTWFAVWTTRGRYPASI